MKLVKSPGLWENMAHSSIKTRRPEVVDFCLSNMEHARAAQAARWAPAAWPVDLPHFLVIQRQWNLPDAEWLHSCLSIPGSEVGPAAYPAPCAQGAQACVAGSQDVGCRVCLRRISRRLHRVQERFAWPGDRLLCSSGYILHSCVLLWTLSSNRQPAHSSV